MFDDFLLFFIVLPLFGCLLVNLKRLETNIHNIAFYYAIFILIVSLFLLFNLSINDYTYSYILNINWLNIDNYSIKFGIDGISIFFIILTTFLIPVCFKLNIKSYISVNYYYTCFFILEFLLLIVFTVLDVLFFYISFESTLIPMFLIIGIWGSRERRIHAAYQLFLYTLGGSVLMLLAIFKIYSFCGSTDLETITLTKFPLSLEKYLFLAFFIAFSVKVPVFPFHIWLPEAHTEAPTGGSVILAGILLKLGTYGLLRFTIPVLPESTIYFTPLVYTLCCLGIIYASLTTIRQIDLKKIIAYSSVAHMAYCIIGLFSLTVEGIVGSILLMIGHGLISSALFILVGIIYDKYHTRIIHYYRGLTMVMPIYSILFLFFTLSNISFPGTVNFVSEFLIFNGLLCSNSFILIIAGIGTLLGASYSLWLYNRLSFGYLNTKTIKYFSDINKKDILLLIPFIISTLVLGLFPTIITDYFNTPVLVILETINYIIQ